MQMLKTKNDCETFLVLTNVRVGTFILTNATKQSIIKDNKSERSERCEYGVCTGVYSSLFNCCFYSTYGS